MMHWKRLQKVGIAMTNKRRYPKLTPKQQYDKYMLAYDEWVKKEMIKHDAEIRANMERIASERANRE